MYYVHFFLQKSTYKLIVLPLSIRFGKAHYFQIGLDKLLYVHLAGGAERSVSGGSENQ